MVDTLTVADRSERMSRIRDKNTKPEMLVRRMVYGMGYRYRLHVKDLPGRPDLVFLRLKKVIFVNGCFWHQHQSPMCRLARYPKSRIDFWVPKLERNRQRDLENQKKLVELGWKILVIWECEINDNDKLEWKIGRFLEGASND